MPDEPNDLRPTLTRLHEQLRAAGDVTPETRALLAGVIDDIHALLASSGSEAPAGMPASPGNTAADSDGGPQSIISRLAAVEQEFEATHPTLASIVSRLIDGLGGMGI